MEIYVCADLTPEQLQRLNASAGDATVHARTNRAQFEKSEVVFGNPPTDWLAECPDLKWIQLESVGFGEYDNSQWPALGNQITVTNLSGFFAEPVAQSILAGILGLYRGIDQVTELRHQERWLGEDLRKSFRTLNDAKVVLFGYGAINKRLAELLNPFRCDTQSFNSQWQEKDLDRALATADVVVSTVPDTPLTRDVFSKRRLALLPQQALFINFGRGSVVDEAALAGALTSGDLGGAVIDVTRDEPLPTGHPFWTCPNLILTQHSGGGTGDEMDLKVDVFIDNLKRYRGQHQLNGIVSFTRGY